MKENKLPSCVEKLIREQGVEKQDILAVSPFDLSFASEYVSGYDCRPTVVATAVSEVRWRCRHGNDGMFR